MYVFIKKYSIKVLKLYRQNFYFIFRFILSTSVEMFTSLDKSRNKLLILFVFLLSTNNTYAYFNVLNSVKIIIGLDGS